MPVTKTKTAGTRAKLQALVRENPIRALHHVALALRYQADDSTVVLARIVMALAEATGWAGAPDPDALTVKHGPHSWAGLYLKKRGVTLLPHKRIDAMKELEAVVRGMRRRSPTDLAFHVTVSLLLKPQIFGPAKTGRKAPKGEAMLRRQRAAEDSKRPLADRWGDLDEVQLHIASEVTKARDRPRHTHEHVAVAVLVGWGWTRTRATGAFKKT
jgi:hypothetical protein